jgi:hypothetical protein
MNVNDQIESTPTDLEPNGADLLLPLVLAKPTAAAPGEGSGGVVVGELLAIADQGRTPLVTFAGTPEGKAVAARSIVDVHAAHIGRRLVLIFEGGDAQKPIVLGILREADGWPLEEKPGQVDVDVDGERLVVTAREQLVLRCGLASITLTKAGKVLIEGSYVSSWSLGVNRLKGGAVQIN